MSGGELLIVDPDERDREGMKGYFESLGYVCTAVAGPQDARDRVTQKFYPVALVDLDVGGPGRGLAVVQYIRERSEPTKVILLTTAEDYDGAVAGLRAGVIDVVLKAPDRLEHLAGVVERTMSTYDATQGDGAILEEVRAVLDESFKVMLGLSRKVYAHLSLANAPLTPSILVVDGDSEMLRELAMLVEDETWQVSAEMNGGAALDKGTTETIHIVACRAELMDLPGSMVLRSIQAQRADVLGLLYSSEGEGKLERVEQGEVVSSSEGFRGSEDLLEALRAVIEDLGMRAEERRFIQAFSADHRGFLRRYADLKLKIDRLLSG